MSPLPRPHAPDLPPATEAPAPADAAAELAGLEARVWQELSHAVATRGHGWRTATLATVTPDGLPDARTVVLREARPEARELLFYTDARSPKVAQIGQQPQAVLVLWSATLGWQLRLRVALAVAEHGLAVSSRWASLKMSPGAQDYLSPLPPGSRLGAPLLQRDSRAHFAVVTASVHAIDWLALGAGGHRRALLRPGEAPQWLQP